MNTRSVAGAVRRLGSAVIPGLPRVRAGFKTLYRQCRPAAGEGTSSQRARPTRIAPGGFDWREASDLAGFYAGHAIGTILSRRARPGPQMLVATTANVPEAILFEPLLRSLAQEHPDHSLQLWGPQTVCDLYGAAPYLSELRAIERPSANPVQRRRANFMASIALGRCRFAKVLCDLRGDPFLTHCFARGLRCESLRILDRSAPLEPPGQEAPAPDFLHALADLAREWNAQIAGEAPIIYPTDRETQFAHSLWRSWRARAAELGATALVAVIPAADPPDVTIGLRFWASIVSELWSKHSALPILFGEGADVGAVEQLASLVDNVPYVHLPADAGILERAALIGRLDAVIGAAGTGAQLALAQNVPAIMAGSEARRRLFAWALRRGAYYLAEKASPSDMLRTYGWRMTRPKIRIAG